MYIQVKQQKKEKDLNDCQSFWIESDKYWICNPCLLHSQSKNVPRYLASGRKGTFGFVSNTGQNCLIVACKKRHTDSLLHAWCIKEYQNESEWKASNDKKNEIAAKRIIRNVLLCFKRSWGSEDFIALNAKNFLDDKDLGISYSATKNDSRKEFFRLRRVIFDILDEKTRHFFSENISNIAVTLDKVTVHRTSFTVIMTYFFNKGKIHIILNKLHKLRTDEYSSEDTATMLIEVLCETLGVSKTKLSKILKHLIYDGVYADKEERLLGGGCLELKKNVAKQLELDPGSITGT